MHTSRYPVCWSPQPRGLQPHASPTTPERFQVAASAAAVTDVAASNEEEYDFDGRSRAPYATEGPNATRA